MMNFYHLPYEQITAVPQQNMPGILHQAYKHRFLHSLIKLIDYAQQVLDKDYSGLISRLDRLEITEKKYISPWLYTQYFWLLEAMRKDSVIEVNLVIRSIIYSTQWTGNEIQITLGLQEDWEKKAFAEEVTTAFGPQKLNAFTPSQDELQGFQSEVLKALQLISATDSGITAEISSLVSTIHLVKSDMNIGATSPKFFGAIYLSAPNGNLSELSSLFLVEHLVHETSHLFLNTILAFDPLILNEEEERFSSPIRSELRPMLGIYHASFVLSRVIRVFKRMKQLNLHDSKQLEACIADLEKKYKAAYTTADKLGILTALGKQILLSTRECALID
ncbi:hypothetical protein Lbir_0670 [Legionella birminghamensis]|uniref:HEXXH motif domain n=1 Tax=Legionella birminghamensis TaxID=28083 RepID=A0A378IB56_9GAMM|nr:HEXXH motif-containing putative peptide modification protein [Legionella birminghamensis]KTC74880.1 hypothetical protein Lbir_0670 [Legionella birminghamensis]STX31781.1 HEXXH motif domain [Legionella birminghamensis]